MFLKRPNGNTPQEMLDKFSIRELIEFERFCRDHGLWDEMKRCFSPDSRVRISWFHGTGQEFADASSSMSGHAVHKMYDTLVWLNGPRAAAVSMAAIQSRERFGGASLDLTSYVQFIYTLEREADAWFIATMDSVYEKDCLVPERPESLSALPTLAARPDRADGAPRESRSSYRNLTHVLHAAGHAIDQGLPGEDRPESVRELYEKAGIWLDSPLPGK